VPTGSVDLPSACLGRFSYWRPIFPPYFSHLSPSSFPQYPTYGFLRYLYHLPGVYSSCVSPPFLVSARLAPLFNPLPRGPPGDVSRFTCDCCTLFSRSFPVSEERHFNPRNTEIQREFFVWVPFALSTIFTLAPRDMWGVNAPPPHDSCKSSSVPPVPSRL